MLNVAVDGAQRAWRGTIIAELDLPGGVALDRSNHRTLRHGQGERRGHRPSWIRRQPLNDALQHYFASTEPAHVRRGYPHPTTLAFSPDSRALASPTVLARGYTHTEGLRRERGDFDQSIRVWSLPEARVASFSAYAAPTQERDLKWINFDPWLGDGRGLVVAEGPTLRLLTPEGALAASLTLPETYGSAREPLRSVDGAYASFETRGHWVRWRLREPARYDRVRAPSALQPPRGSEYPAPGQFPAEGLHRSSSDRESPGPRDMRQ